MAEPQRFDVEFKKVPGTLTLTATHVAWVPTTPGAMDRQQQAVNRVIRWCCARLDEAQVHVPEGGLLFTFTGPSKETDRQRVRDVILPFVAVHRGAAVPAPGWVGPAPAAGTPTTGSATPAAIPAAAIASASTSAGGTPAV